MRDGRYSISDVNRVSNYILGEMKRAPDRYAAMNSNPFEEMSPVLVAEMAEWFSWLLFDGDDDNGFEAVWGSDIGTDSDGDLTLSYRLGLSVPDVEDAKRKVKDDAAWFLLSDGGCQGYEKVSSALRRLADEIDEANKRA